MIQQLRLLDPSVSAEVGTPERKLLDTFASALNDSQVDLGALQNSLDIDAKYGASLDRFLQIFGFSRQRATYATGFVTFSRPTPATADIRIPANSLVRASAVTDTNADAVDVTFYTTFEVILAAGETESGPVPIRANIAGSFGNVAADRIKEIVGQTLIGVTSVTNLVPTSGGKDMETDDEYKVRFKNTVFRNLAGTEDQYLALAIATAFTTRANVVGPQSRYREYIQVPSVADNTNYDINGDSVAEAGGGLAGEYTTALSTLPYAKQLWTNVPAFVSSGVQGLATNFFKQDIDFRFNSTASARARGDALRLFTAYGTQQADPNSTSVLAPNITFTNIYTGVDASIQAVRPGDVVLLEFSYLSDASRNDLTNNVTNAVDVYIDGSNQTQASTVIPRPTTANLFVMNASSKFHVENYRRGNDPMKRPLVGNVLTPLFWAPVLGVPEQIIVGTVTYYEGTHYWQVTDVSELRGTVRSRDGIEWSTKVFGKAGTDPNSTDPSVFTGKIITDPTGDPLGGQAIEITDYTFDNNIVTLQAALEGSKQVTTDVLAHQATRRFFRFDVSVMYTQGTSQSEVNLAIHDAVDRLLRSQYFGSVVQLSDILQAIHNVAGVDNVRWTSDIPLPNTGATQSLPRVVETNDDGIPLLGVTTERYQPGTALLPEIQEIYINGAPTAGSFQLVYGATVSNPILGTTPTTLAAEISSISGATATVTELTGPTNLRWPQRVFRATWSANGARTGLTVQKPTTVAPLSGGPFVINNDFFLRDSELAQLPTNAYTPLVGTPDTVPGLIIRPRAQGTWPRGI